MSTATGCASSAVFIETGGDILARERLSLHRECSLSRLLAIGSRAIRFSNE